MPTSISTDLSDYPVVVHVLSRIDFRSGKVRLRHPAAVLGPTRYSGLDCRVRRRQSAGQAPWSGKRHPRAKSASPLSGDGRNLLLLLVDQRLDELGDVLLAGCGAVELATHVGKCLVDLCKALVDVSAQVDEVLP